MASKMKNIDPKKTSLFYPEDGFHPKKTSWSLGGTKPFPNFWILAWLYKYLLGYQDI